MPNSKEKGFTSVYRNSKFYQELTSTPDPSIKTFRDVLIQSCLQKFSDNKFAGTIFISWKEKSSWPKNPAKKDKKLKGKFNLLLTNNVLKKVKCSEKLFWGLSFNTDKKHKTWALSESTQKTESNGF